MMEMLLVKTVILNVVLVYLIVLIVLPVLMQHDKIPQHAHVLTLHTKSMRIHVLIVITNALPVLQPLQTVFLVVM